MILTNVYVIMIMSFICNNELDYFVTSLVRRLVTIVSLFA